MNTLNVVAFVIVAWRIVTICADIPKDFLREHSVRAVGMGMALAVTIAASVGVLGGMAGAGDALLIAMALLAVSDRRNRMCP